jgi:ATP-dependent RNA helicase RhlE
VRVAQPEPLIEEETGQLYQDLDLHPQLKANLKERGFEQTTPIQSKVLEYVSAGRDILGMAATGTGKTAAFLVPLFNSALKNPGKNKVLIVAPTRELALQIQSEFNALEQRKLKLFSISLVGGTPVFKDVKSLRKTHDFYIGTPGRLIDLINRGTLKVNDVSTFVLDEADQMLDMGFADDIKEIRKKLPEQHQTLLFTATMNKKMRPFATNMLHDPMTVEVKQQDASKNVHQNVVFFDHHTEKVDKLEEILKQDTTTKTLVFTETKRQADELADELDYRGHKVEAIHGDKSLGQRRRGLDNFKKGYADVLVATDVAARGIDVKHITHVINYDEPNNYEIYTHRIGRTGRAGSTGNALTFIRKSGSGRHH